MVTYPADWNTCNLGDIGRIKMCRRIFQYQTTPIGDIPFYKIGTFGDTADAYINKSLFEAYKAQYSYPSPGDILISAAGTVGKAVVFDGKDSYFQDSNIVWLDVDRTKVDQDYLYWFYRSFPWRALEGTTISRLYNNIILNTPILLPPLKEQRAIAETLTQFDDMVSSLDALIEKKHNIREAALDDLATGKSRLDGFSDDWKMVSFDEVITPKARIGWQGLKKDEYLTQGYSYLIGGTDFSDGHIRLVGINYVSKERYDLDENIQVTEDDILVTKDGTVGKVAIVQKLNHPATLNSGVFVFRTKRGLHPKFLYRVLSSSVFKDFIDALSAGSTIKHLYQKDLKRFAFNMPSSVSEQLAIADTLGALDSEISALEAERDKWKQIRDGAMDDLLTGRVRLKDWEV